MFCRSACGESGGGDGAERADRAASGAYCGWTRVRKITRELCLCCNIGSAGVEYGTARSSSQHYSVILCEREYDGGEEVCYAVVEWVVQQ